MLGVLSKSPEGLKLLEKAKIFTLLYHLSDLRGRDDIITAAIGNLDYQMLAYSGLLSWRSAAD